MAGSAIGFFSARVERRRPGSRPDLPDGDRRRESGASPQSSDYAGNNMFQTLGNISTHPRVGLLFVDFDSGTTLQLTGRARILWDRANFPGLTGAERAVEVEIDEVVEIDGQGPLGWRFLGYSPFNPP